MKILFLNETIYNVKIMVQFQQFGSKIPDCITKDQVGVKWGQSDCQGRWF